MKDKKLLILLLSIIIIIFIIASTFYKRHHKNTAVESAAILKFIDEINLASRTMKERLFSYRNKIHTNASSHKIRNWNYAYINDIGEIINPTTLIRSSIYYGKASKLPKDLIEFLETTDLLEELWLTYEQKNPYLTWQFVYHIPTGTIRLLPKDDFSFLKGEKIDWKLIKYYKNNFALKDGELTESFCTTPYKDYGGTGFMISCCIDISINNNKPELLACQDYWFFKHLQNLRKILILENSNYDIIRVSSNSSDQYFPQLAVVDYDINTSEISATSRNEAKDIKICSTYKNYYNQALKLNFEIVGGCGK